MAMNRTLGRGGESRKGLMTAISKRGFLKAISRRQPDAEEIRSFYSEKEWEVQKAAMSESSGVLGGYLVPQEFSYELLRPIAENSFIEPRATVITMGSAESLCPSINQETARSAGISPFFGGIEFVWNQAAEGSNIYDASSTNEFSQVGLKAWDLIGEIQLTNQFLADLTDEGEEQLLFFLGRAAAWYKEYAFLRGTGTANYQPLGIVNAGTTSFVTRAGSNALAQADIAKMTAELIPYSWNHAIWACSPSVVEPLVKITGFIPNMDPLSTEMGCIGSLMTRPVFVTEKLPALGTAGDILFFDPSLYIIGNRQEVYITSSPAPGFTTNTTWLKIWIRCDGRPQTSGIITLADGATTASAFVGLAA